MRIGHWILVAVFTLNYFLLEPGGDIHQWLGYTAFTVVLVRLLWACLSTGYASFQSLQLHPGNFKQHFHHLRHRQIPFDTGHNPVGWLMIFATWFSFIGLAVTGFMMEEIDAWFGNSLLQDIHGFLSDLLYAIVLLHILAVFIVGWWGHIPLVRPMITGYRTKR